MARKNALTQKVINKLLRGQHGHIWFNGKELATVQKCEAKMEGDFEDINVCGDPATYSVYNGWSGSGTLEYLKFDTEIMKLVVESFLSGEMPECQIITLLENESTGRRERCRIGIVTFTEATILAFEKKALITESVPFKFADFEYLETIEF